MGRGAGGAVLGARSAEAPGAGVMGARFGQAEGAFAGAAPGAIGLVPLAALGAPLAIGVKPPFGLFGRCLPRGGLWGCGGSGRGGRRVRGRWSGLHERPLWTSRTMPSYRYTATVKHVC